MSLALHSGPFLSVPSVTAVCHDLWLASSTFLDTIGKCWALVPEWCLLNPSYWGNLAAPVIVTSEKLTGFQSACCSYTLSCSLISIRCVAWFSEIQFKVWCSLAVLTEEVNGRDQLSALEFWIPKCNLLPWGRLQSMQGLDVSYLDKNNPSSWCCEHHIYMDMF